MREKINRVIISGGGTGGHIFPAIAIANSIKRRNSNAEILFVGAKDRMEMQKVPESGYKIEGLWISGFQRSFSRRNLLFPFKLISTLIKSKKIIRKFQPDLVIGTGGFASGPLLYAGAIVCWLLYCLALGATPTLPSLDFTSLQNLSKK